MHLEYARQFDKILGTDGFFTRNCVAAAESKYPDHFAEAAEAEAVATTIREYAPLLIPGLLQTEAYARAVCRAYQPTAPDSAIEDVVTARLERARLLGRSNNSSCCGQCLTRPYCVERQEAGR